MNRKLLASILGLSVVAIVALQCMGAVFKPGNRSVNLTSGNRFCVENSKCPADRQTGEECYITKGQKTVKGYCAMGQCCINYSSTDVGLSAPRDVMIKIK